MTGSDKKRLYPNENIKTVCYISNLPSRLYRAQIVGWINASSDNIDDERRLFDGLFKKYE
jgi:virginiamycin A acetyltransferase